MNLIGERRAAVLDHGAVEFAHMGVAHGGGHAAIGHDAGEIRDARCRICAAPIRGATCRTPNRRSSPRRHRRAQARSTSCWPQAPGAKSPFSRNGRSAFRCGEMIGSPPRPGTSVNSVATIEDAALARSADKRRELVRQRRDGGHGLAGAAIGAIAMQEIVLQVAEDERARRLNASRRLHDQVAELDRSGRRAQARSRSWRRAARGWRARESLAPAGRSSRAQMLVSRHPPSNQTGRDPSRAFSSDAEGSGANTAKSNAGRRPIAATRSETIRIGKAGQQPAERREIGRLERRADHGSRVTPSAARAARPAAALRPYGSARDNACRARRARRCARPRMPAARDHRARLLRRPPRIRRSSAARVKAVEHEIERLHHVVPQVGEHAAERRGDAGKARHQRAFEADLPDQGADVQRAAAAERHGDEARRIMAALDRDEPDRAGHARVGDPHDGGRGRHRRRGRAACRHASRWRVLAAVDVERFSSPPSGRAALMRPSTTWASVSVGRVLPWP